MIFFTVLLSAQVPQATTYPLSFVKLSGLSGGSPAATAVYKADLSGITTTTGLQSLTITDNSSGSGGSPGQFSGFDLDAVILSYDLFTDATSINTATALNLFNYTGGSIFTPGAQRTPTDTKLFGTDSSGIKVDNSVATLGSFDGNSTTAIPGALGFLIPLCFQDGINPRPIG
jgi:hypothetical protein